MEPQLEFQMLQALVTFLIGFQETLNVGMFSLIVALKQKLKQLQKEMGKAIILWSFMRLVMHLD